MSAARTAAIVLVSALATAGLGWLSRAPYDPPDADAALLRLSWRLRGEKNEACRARSPAELDALPVHMRTPEVCESHLLAYRLTVRIDDAPPDAATVLPGGARGDRPVFVLREVPLAPGDHRVSLSFVRQAAEHDEEDEDHDRSRVEEHGEHDEADEDHDRSRVEEHGAQRREERASRVSLVLDTVISVNAGDVHLITLSPDGRRFVHVAPDPR